MRNIFFILTVILVFSFKTSIVLGEDLLDLEETQDIACEDLEYNTEVVFTTSFGDLSYDFTYNKQSLTKKAQDVGVIERGMFASGLATVEINSEIDLNTISRILEDDDVCVIPVTVNVFIGYENPVIYISKDLESGSCDYDVALRHEQTHQQINKTTLEHFVPKFKDVVGKMSKDIKPVAVDNLSKANDAHTVLVEEYSEKLIPLIEFFKEELKKEHRKLDSFDNYKLEGELCN